MSSTASSQADAVTAAYSAWKLDPSQANMAGVIRAVEPYLSAVVRDYNGPKPLLLSRARSMVPDLVRKFDPSKASLRTWIDRGMQPLSRYAQRLRPIHMSEAVARQAAEVNSRRMELADQLLRDPDDNELAEYTGISVDRLKKLRAKAPATVAESSFSDLSGEQILPATQTISHMSEAADIVRESMTPAERQVYDGRTTGGLGVAQLAKSLRTSPASISQTAAGLADRINKVDHALIN